MEAVEIKLNVPRILYKGKTEEGRWVTGDR